MNTHIKKFSEVKTHPSRALQAWQILVSSAMNRQTQTYKIVIDSYVWKYCFRYSWTNIRIYCTLLYQNNLPPLTVIVVNSKTGLPGDEIPVSEDLKCT